MSLLPGEGAYARSVKGSCSPHDLEVALQLIHLLMTSDLKLEAGEMDSVMVQLRQGIEAQLRSPLHAYHTRIRQINYEGCYFFDPITLDELEKVRVLLVRGATSAERERVTDAPAQHSKWVS